MFIVQRDTAYINEFCDWNAQKVFSLIQVKSSLKIEEWRRGRQEVGGQGQVDPEGNCSVEVRGKRRKLKMKWAARWPQIGWKFPWLRQQQNTAEQAHLPLQPSLSPLPTSLPRSQSISFQMQFAKGHAHTSTSLTHSKTTTIKAEKNIEGK